MDSTKQVLDEKFVDEPQQPKKKSWITKVTIGIFLFFGSYHAGAIVYMFFATVAMLFANGSEIGHLLDDNEGMFVFLEGLKLIFPVGMILLWIKRKWGWELVMAALIIEWLRYLLEFYFFYQVSSNIAIEQDSFIEVLWALIRGSFYYMFMLTLLLLPGIRQNYRV